VTSVSGPTSRNWPHPSGMAPTAPSSVVVLYPPRKRCHKNAPGRVKWLLLHKPEELNPKDVAYRQALFRLDPRLSPLSALGQGAGSPARLTRKMDALVPWLERAKGCPYEELQRFAQGLEKEFSAVQAALDSTLEHWTGRGTDHQTQAPDVRAC